MHPELQVLLATYNGGDFISEQLNSLVNQTFVNFELLVSDDGSIDDTLHIVRSYSDRIATRIIDKPHRHGKSTPKANFEFLIRSSSAPLLAFCDQDDIWDADKLANQVEFARRPENYGNQLFYCDARIVDASGRVVAASFFEDAKKDPTRNALNQILVENVVSGNMTMVRGEFARSAMPIPETSPGHDWWLAAHAAAAGALAHLPQQLLSYRQHSQNAIGAPGLSIRTVLREVHALSKADLGESRVSHKVDQARAIAELLNIQHGPAAALGSLTSKSKLRRVETLFRHRLWHDNTIRNIGFLILI